MVNVRVSMNKLRGTFWSSNISFHNEERVETIFDPSRASASGPGCRSDLFSKKE